MIHFLPIRAVKAVSSGVLSLLLLLGGCATQDPLSHGPEVSRQGTAHGYVVQRGDTIYGIARQLNLSVRSLIDGNGLQPPFQLTPGQVLTLPNAGDYVVVKGDTLIGVARKTGVPFSTLARLNELTAPYVLQVGQGLKLPATARAKRPVNSAEVPTTPPVIKPLVQDQPSPRSLAERDVKPVPASGGSPGPAISPPAETKLAAATVIAAPSKHGRGFIWPAKGEILQPFGSSGKGQHNDGINIKLPRGTQVVAAQDGVVAYAGNELRGFGNLLLIKHADGWMTAYAHNDALMVKRGEAVKRGQKIAKSGESGGVTPPQLHFEIRQGTRAMDPEDILGGKAIPTAAPDDQPDPG